MDTVSPMIPPRRMPRLNYVLRCSRQGCGRVVTRVAPWWTLRAECEGECGVVTMGSLL